MAEEKKTELQEKDTELKGGMTRLDDGDLEQVAGGRVMVKSTFLDDIGEG